MMQLKSSRHQGIKASSRLRLRLASSHASSRRTSIIARAFTLIELMVVVAIILLLAALTVTVTTALSAGSDIRETENVIRLLDNAYDEWANTSKRQITFGTDGQPPQPVGQPQPRYDIQESDYPVDEEEEQSELLSKVLEIIGRNAPAQSILQRIDSDFLKRIQHPGEPEHLHLFDAWDNEIRVVFPGRLSVASDPNDRRDPDGTYRTDQELRYGACVNRRICFFSAGPDGDFGNIRLNDPDSSLSDNDRADIDRAADNIYSYQLRKR